MGMTVGETTAYRSTIPLPLPKDEAMSTSDRSADRDPLEVLAEEFVARYRQGERPALTEYVQNYPELAEQIQELFPALLMMEKVKPAEGKPVLNPLSGPPPGAVKPSPYRAAR